MHGPTCIFWANLTPFSRQELEGIANCFQVTREQLMQPFVSWARVGRSGPPDVGEAPDGAPPETEPQ